MCSTCLFCHAPLGANETLERFPVGRRIAFDAAKGRLWVVCTVCRQWNLSPLEERWEAIADAERLYRDTKLRVATDQVGLARLRDGLELVRIGRPVLPEFAAWRYGDRFTTRWRRHTGIAVAGAALTIGYTIAGPIAGVIWGGLGGLPWSAYSIIVGRLHGRRVVARLADPDGPIALTDSHLVGARVIKVEGQAPGWQLSIPHIRSDVAVGKFVGRSTDIFDKRLILSGAEAVAAARAILPRINRSGGRAKTVAEAVTLLEETGSIDKGFERAAQTLGRDGSGDPSRDLRALPAPLRLALEMAVHTDVERRALEGELATLEAAWKEAEEIAAIADELTLPEWMATRLERLTGG